MGNVLLKLLGRASLVVQWLRIRLPMQGTRVQALVREDPTCRGATKLVRHNYWACALEPASHNYWSLRATTTEARAPRARAPRQEKPLRWEACAPQWRVVPARCNWRKPVPSNKDPTQPKIINKFIKKKKKRKHKRNVHDLQLSKEFIYMTPKAWSIKNYW